MKIAVFSDSHSHLTGMVNTILTEKPDAVIHLGDLESDANSISIRFPDLPVYAVCGNCDLMPINPERTTIEFGGKRIFMTHGHRYSVKLGLGKLINAAMADRADVVMYGHTHIPYHETVDDLHVINPGAAGPGGSYGILTITSDGISYEGKRIV